MSVLSEKIAEIEQWATSPEEPFLWGTTDMILQVAKVIEAELDELRDLIVAHPERSNKVG